MKTTILQVEINTEDLPIFESLFKKFKAKTKIIKQNKEEDDVRMDKEEYFAMIDKAREEKGNQTSAKALKKMFLK